MGMKPRTIYNRFSLILTDTQADWDVWEYWEQERYDHMAARLSKDDTLFDIGAEHGSISAMYALLVGAENMVLFEPSPSFWPNIRLTFTANRMPAPLDCVVALVGAAESADPPDIDFNGVLIDGWPHCAWDDTEEPLMRYRYLHEHANSTPTVTIDEYVKRTGIVPDAITMDVEGAEWEILAGAREVLTNVGPKVWMSVHPDLMRRDFNTDQSAVFSEMAAMGYTAEHIHTDHEEHWFFSP